MFCGKCGNQIEEGVTFCPKCGNKIGTDSSDNDNVSIVHSRETKTNFLNKNYKKIGIAIGAVLAAVLVWVLFLRDAVTIKTIDLNQYVQVHTEGYDGYGRAKLDLDTEGLCNDFIGKYKLKETDNDVQSAIRGISDGLGLTDLACAEYFLSMIGNVNLSKGEGLSNGDSIVVSWDTLDSNNKETIEKRIRETFNIKIEYSDDTINVSNLKPVEYFDPFEGSTFQFTGIEGTRDISVVPERKDGVSFSLEGSGPFSNGDAVVLKATPVSYADWDEYVMNTGTAPKNDTLDVNVSGLGTFITKLDQIPSDYLNLLKESADKQVSAYANQKISDGKWKGKSDRNYQFEYTSPTLCKEYLLSSTDELSNELIFLYRMDFDMQFEMVSYSKDTSRTGSVSGPVYVAYAFNNKKMVVEPSGDISDSDTTGAVVESNDTLRLYYDVYDGYGEKREHYNCWFEKAYSMEVFELDHIDTSAFDKDIKEIN